MREALRGIGPYYNAARLFIDDNVERGLGDKTAIYYKDQEITYRELQKLVNQFANGIRQLAELENRVLIVLYDSPQFIISFFGCIKVGVVPVPVNTMMTVKDYEYFLNNSRAKVLVIQESIWKKLADCKERFPYLQHVIVCRDDDGRKEKETALADGVLDFDRYVNQQSDQVEPVHTVRDDAAFWLYTSGSTGNPKGAIHLQHDMEYAFRSYAQNILEIDENDITFSASKLFFAYGLGNGMYFPLGAGASTVLMPDRPLPERVFETIERYRPSLFFGVPTLYGSMIDLAERSGRVFDLSSIRLCVSAGEPLPASFVRKWRQLFNVDILDGIGTTEILHIFISNRPGDIREGSTGKIVPGYEAKVVNEQGIPLSPGEIGDLIIKGDSTAHAYWNMHEENKRKFNGEWYVTGDKYYMDEEGYFWYCGRSDDMLKVGGMWVSPIEIENALLQHEAVLEAAVVGVRDEHNLDKPKAFIVLKEGYQPGEGLKRELMEFVKGNLAPYKYPRMIQFVDSLPKTATGKIQRFKLREESYAAK